MGSLGTRGGACPPAVPEALAPRPPAPSLSQAGGPAKPKPLGPQGLCAMSHLTPGLPGGERNFEPGARNADLGVLAADASPPLAVLPLAEGRRSPN